jgi:O-antigen/teichoic acid export membrane protein
LVVWGFGVKGALTGFVFSFLVATLLGLKLLPKEIFSSQPNEKIDFKPVYAFFLPTTVGLFCFASLINMDVPLVRHFFSSEETGIYSVAQLVGKIMFFLPSALSVVMLPKITNCHMRDLDTKKLLGKNLFLAGSLLASLGVFIFIFPEFSLSVLAKTFNPACINLARLFVICMLFFSLSSILLTYFLSIKNFLFIYMLAGGALVQFVLINIFHSSLEGVLYILSGVSICLFSSGLIILKYGVKK